MNSWEYAKFDQSRNFDDEGWVLGGVLQTPKDRKDIGPQGDEHPDATAYRMINKLGEQRWELVTVEYYNGVFNVGGIDTAGWMKRIFWFKRPVTKVGKE